jgi:hypothetical protein
MVIVRENRVIFAVSVAVNFEIAPVLRVIVLMLKSFV